MRIFIQLDDAYVQHLNVLEPILLDLINILHSESALIIEDKHTIYLVSTLPKPVDTIEVEWVHPDQAAHLIEDGITSLLIHFGPVAKWAKRLPAYFIPLSIPYEHGHKSWIKSWIDKKRYHKIGQAATRVLALDEWHAQNRPGATRLYLEKAPLPNFEWSQLAAARTALTDGNQYLIAFVGADNIIPIAKAFSVFKKWQLSTMSLVFVMDTEAEKEKAAHLLLGYKFRDAVALVCLSNFKLEWIAAAYLSLFGQMNSHRFQFLTYTMRYQIPFLMHQDATDKAFVLPAMAEAGEHFDFRAPDLLANHFKLYYKDEMYRAAKGIEIHKAVQTAIRQFQEKATIAWPRDLV